MLPSAFTSIEIKWVKFECMERCNSLMNRPEILVVDDSSTASYFMANALQYAGYTVDVALNGQEGLQKALKLRPRCIVLDIILPDTNGYAICRRVRALDPQHTIFIVFVSSKNTPFDRTYGLSLGADHYLAKPFTGEVLVQTIGNLLPPRVRPATYSLPKNPYETLAALIPRRREDTTLLATKNPFTSSMHMDDSAHHVYKAINGRRTVRNLCEVTRFDIQQVARVLKILFDQQRIEFWDQGGPHCSDIAV